MKYEFSNMTTEQTKEQLQLNKDSFLNYWDTIFISKESFTVELDRKKVKLHLYIEDIDMAEFSDDTDSHEIIIGIIPNFKSLTKNNKENILNQFSDEDKKEYKKDTDMLIRDVFDYGFNLPLHVESEIDKDEADYKIDSAIAVSPCVSGLIGFDLDRHVNMIGNTGWDLISDWCEGKDSLKTALKRFKK